MKAPMELVGTALESTKTHRRKPKRERGRGRAHHGENWRRIRLGLAGRRTVDHGGAPAGYATVHCALRESRSGRESKIGARRRLGLKRGQKGKARGREKDRGERGPAVLNRERGEREETVGREGDDRWAPSVGERERGRGRGSWPAGPRPRKRRRGRRVWALQDERRRGRREERFAFFLFQIKFPNIFSN